jgi:hypothetical protein
MLQDLCAPFLSQQPEDGWIIQQFGLAVNELVSSPETGHTQGSGTAFIFLHGLNVAHLRTPRSFPPVFYQLLNGRGNHL